MPNTMMILIPWQSFILANNWQKTYGNGFSIIVPWMLLIVFRKVMSWILLFHLLFWCHKIIFRETSYCMVFGAISQYWEQKLRIFDDVLLEETAHAQLGYHTRKSLKAWKNSVQWGKCQGMLFASAVSSFLNFSQY